MGVGGNDQSETPDPILIKRLPQQARIRSAVDKYGLSAGGEQQRCVSLTDIDKDDGRPTGYARHDRHRHDCRDENKHHRADPGPTDAHQNRSRQEGDRADAELGVKSGAPGDGENDIGSDHRRPQQRSASHHHPDRSQESRGCHQRGCEQIGQRRQQWNAIALGEEKWRHRDLGGDGDSEWFSDQLRKARGQQVVSRHDAHRGDQRELET